ncbi:uncharacterized protein LOC120293482 [Eucalyptus grandis]|uniref:uncharacterized protein LOC120293482 n=1 Tax=Eucalyptus grandis TaxID=71139 RepID=UPI00192EB5E9|nr:uncharacterized protein LOC120293482 [Eucalyptus grandis]
MRRSKEEITCKFVQQTKIVIVVEAEVTFKEEVVDEVEEMLLKVTANLVTDADQVLLLAFKEDEGGQTDTWYLDSSASNHMCGRKEMFTKLDEKIKGKVSFNNNSKILVEGKGTILIRLKIDACQFITNIYYVPKMSSNILNLGLRILANTFDELELDATRAIDKFEVIGKRHR